jgi:hypothetical protein
MALIEEEPMHAFAGLQQLANGGALSRTQRRKVRRQPQALRAGEDGLDPARVPRRGNPSGRC